LRTDEGDLLTENGAILQYVAARFPGAKLAPESGIGRARLQQWLSYIATELHKAVFIPLLDDKAPVEAKAYAAGLADARFGLLDRHLAGREFLLDEFSVADAYLATVLNWTRAVPIDLATWPNVKAYHSRLRKRPSVARAWEEELALYNEEQARSKAA
jgi:glutathione S-transferase